MFFEMVDLIFVDIRNLFFFIWFSINDLIVKIINKQQYLLNKI